MVLKVSLNTGINRIRLEFKVPCHYQCTSGASPVLIESDWNLKHINTGTYLICFPVLIESDWNLKLIQGNVWRSGRSY